VLVALVAVERHPLSARNYEPLAAGIRVRDDVHPSAIRERGKPQHGGFGALANAVTAAFAAVDVARQQLGAYMPSRRKPTENTG